MKIKPISTRRYVEQNLALNNIRVLMSHMPEPPDGRFVEGVFFYRLKDQFLLAPNRQRTRDIVVWAAFHDADKIE